MGIMLHEPAKRRRWLQFRLRTLLIGVLVLSLPLSWFAMRMERARKQREAVRALRDLGGTVRYEWQALRNETFMRQPQPSWLRNTLGSDFFDKVVDVNLGSTHVTDWDLEHLTQLSDLQLLCLRDTQITDAGLEHLRGLRSLEILDLSGTPVTDAGLKHLNKLRNLVVLDLRNSMVSEPGVERLQKTMHNCRVR